jgi:hypothetical protein
MASSFFNSEFNLGSFGAAANSVGISVSASRTRKSPSFGAGDLAWSRSAR